MKQFKELAHIAVLTENMEQSIAFYEKLGGVCEQRGSVNKPTGTNLLAMVKLAGFWLELIQPGDGTPVDARGGVLPHLAIEVEDLPSCVEQLKAMGIDTFKTDQITVLPELFGGLQNIFFTGPSGELIELIEHF